ncbi:MAG: flavodoxin family protein [Firmicutes bacterium]|nr:flavodoxin family protein [Bacillota bacterium]
MGDKDKGKKKKSDKHKSSDKHEKHELQDLSNGYGENALVLFGSPKKNGHTGKLVEAFLKVKNIEAEYIYVNNLEIKGCQGCLYCQSNDGDCKPKDDMTALYDKIKNAKKIIIAFPIYYGSIPGEFKCMIDRVFAVSSLEKIDGNNIYKSRWENTRDIFLIVSHGNSINPVLESVQRIIKYFCVDTNSVLKGSYFSKPMDMYDLKDDNSFIEDLLNASKEF